MQQLVFADDCGCHEGAVKSFDHTIDLRMVIRCSDVVKTLDFRQMEEKFGLELRTTVRKNFERDAETDHPDLHEGSIHVRCCNLVQWDCFNPSSGSIDAGKKVPVGRGVAPDHETPDLCFVMEEEDERYRGAGSRTWSRACRRIQGYLGVTVDFCLLTVLTFADPLSNFMLCQARSSAEGGFGSGI